MKKNPPAPTRPKIVLAKLRPGQVISVECHAVKGIGQDHAKFSPVGKFVSTYMDSVHCIVLFCAATATYRLHPHITLLKQPPPHLARKFADCFSPGVIKVVNEGTRMSSLALKLKTVLICSCMVTEKAKVKVDEKCLRGESMTREVFRHAEFEGCVKLGRIRDHFLCMSLHITFLAPSPDRG